MSVYAPTQKPVMSRASSAMDPSALRVPTMPQRHKKTVSTGGGRAWSDAEEAYLIETREHKMPYKHIAAQLKKTELACRLHYHQLSFGSKARRNVSVSSLSSFDRSPITPSSRRGQSTPQLRLPSYSPPTSPDSPVENSSHKNPTTAATTPSDLCQPPKPLLPRLKPTSAHPSHRSTGPANTTGHDARQLRLVTDNVDTFHERQPVDIARLDRIYDAHRLHFWSEIARAYGCNLSPSALEDAWRRAHYLTGSTGLPPTPRGSPQSSSTSALGVSGSASLGIGALTPSTAVLTPFSAVEGSSSLSACSPSARGGFTPINGSSSATGYLGSHQRAESVPPPKSASSSFAISSLLTEDREIRRGSPTVLVEKMSTSPQKEKGEEGVSVGVVEEERERGRPRRSEGAEVEMQGT